MISWSHSSSGRRVKSMPLRLIMRASSRVVMTASTSGMPSTFSCSRSFSNFFAVQGITDTTKIQDLSVTANIVLPSANFALIVKNGVILCEKDAQLEDADVTWTTNKLGLFGIVQKNEDAIRANLTQEGDETLLPKLMEGIAGFGGSRFFEIIEP